MKSETIRRAVMLWGMRLLVWLWLCLLWLAHLGDDDDLYRRDFP
jgi:hypothetical protein